MVATNEDAMKGALKEIMAQGCIDYRAYPDQQPSPAVEGIPVAECATYTFKPDVELCAACIAKDALKFVGEIK